MKRTSTLPYFPIDSGKDLIQFGGLPFEVTGLCHTLRLYYWENECSLPPKDWLIRRLRLKGKQVALLDQIVEDFFPDGVHEYLDQCWDNAMDRKRKNSENARRGHEQRKTKQIEETDEDF